MLKWIIHKKIPASTNASRVIVHDKYCLKNNELSMVKMYVTDGWNIF